MQKRFRPPPVDEPDAELQDDALRKGLGRAVLWAERGRLTDESVLLDSCLHDRRYDSQIEECRGDWLWSIMGAAGAKELVRGPLLESLRDGLVEEDAQQACEIAFRYAQDGDSRFAKAIWKLVSDRRFSQCPWIGEKELMRLDGEAGLIVAARVRGIALNDPGEWEDGSLVDAADSLLGKNLVRDTLTRAAETDADVRRYYEAWQSYERKWSASPKPRPRSEWISAIPAEQAIATIESNRRAIPTEHGTATLRGWGMHATESDLRIVLSRLWDWQDPAVLAIALEVFSNRTLPEFEARLLDLIWHSDAEVRRRAITAVAQNSHPSIRRMLETATLDDSHIELFERNFVPGDEELIDSLIPTEGEIRLHGAFYDLLDVLERNLDCDCSWLAFRAYELTPCGRCRRAAVKLLLDRRCAPGWLAEDCRFDSEPDTRALLHPSLHGQ